jgi:hypothetical protein
LQTAESTRLTLHDLAHPGIEAVLRYWRPFVLIQLSALLLVLAFFWIDAVRNVCAHLAELKARFGVVYSIIVGAIAGGIVPEFAKVIALNDRKFDRKRIDTIIFHTCFFAFIGLLTDGLYRGLTLLFGDAGDMVTAIKKMLTDQFVFTPLVGMVIGAAIFRLRTLRWKPIALIRELGLRWYLTRVITLMIPCWAYWIPMTLMIYTLPKDLQFSLFALALAAWSLVQTFIAAKH